MELKIKKKNQLLFSRDSLCLQDLIGLIQIQHLRTLVMWALDCAEVTLSRFEEKYPDETRPGICLVRCEEWARGKIKMPEARQAILGAHAAAKEIDDQVYSALCRAIGHAGATVHVESHAMGLPIYELTAIVRKHGPDHFAEPVKEKIRFYEQRLHYWQETTDTLELDWAQFLLDDSKPNKEKLVGEKKKANIYSPGT
ncbi:putative immunity protein [Bhargavaea ginsengi]|uniref:putative immunity protein n=1 Tax=Bhargavaea ginsengi TaxID=426757 RepID=UPI001C4302CF|nr:hypothetical protein [Bhargavaea ginsengi]